MQSKSGRGNNEAEVNHHHHHGDQQPMMYPEPWWKNNAAFGVIPQQERPSNSSSLDCPNGSESNDVRSAASEDGGGGGAANNGENDAAWKDSSQAVTSSPSVGHHGMEGSDPTHVAASMHNQQPVQPPELVGHYMACVPNPYQDPYYAGMMGAYGHQPLGFRPYLGMPRERTALPLDITQEPVYVNAKQYEGILRRRKARAKAELERKVINRKPYLHESRHKHAMRRARASGGRFAKKTEAEAAEDAAAASREREKGSATNSSGSEPVDSNETMNSSGVP